MNKAEKIFWALLFLTAGMIIGAVLMAITSPPYAKSKCNDGTSEQIVDGHKIKTYIPALDECKNK